MNCNLEVRSYFQKETNPCGPRSDSLYKISFAENTVCLRLALTKRNNASKREKGVILAAT